MRWHRSPRPPIAVRCASRTTFALALDASDQPAVPSHVPSARATMGERRQQLLHVPSAMASTEARSLGQAGLGKVRAEYRQLLTMLCDLDGRRNPAVQQAVERLSRNLQLTSRALTGLSRHDTHGDEERRGEGDRGEQPQGNATRVSSRRCHGSSSAGVKRFGGNT